MHALDRAAHLSAWKDRGTGGKLALSLGLMLAAMAGAPPLAPLAVFGAAVGLALLSARVPAVALAGALLPPAGFLLASLPALALTLDWHGGLALGWAPGGLAAALVPVGRSLAAVAALALLTLTTPASRLIGLLRGLGLPAAVADVALLTYRLLFLLGDSVISATRAQAFRLGYAGGWRRSLRSLSLLAAGLLGRAMNAARRLDVGLAARCYGDGPGDGLAVLAPGRRTRPGEWALAAGLPALILVGGWGGRWMLS